MQIVGDAQADAAAAAAAGDGTAPAPAGRFHAVIIVEGIETGDMRTFFDLGFRDLPLPLSATIETGYGHDGAIVVGQFDRLETVAGPNPEHHGWGFYVAEPTDEQANLIGMIQRKELPWISADIDWDNSTVELLFPVEDANGDPLMDPMFGGPPPEQEVGDDGITYDVVTMTQPKERYTGGRIMGATAVPFPAMQEAYIEPDEGAALAAAGAPLRLARGGVVTSPRPTGKESGREKVVKLSPFNFPELPPRAWFEMPEPDQATALTILDSGQVFGHLAEWGQCHIGIAGECITPPRSACNYARFHLGEVPVAEGGRVSVGHLTFGAGGHADPELGSDATRSHYDRTCNTGADITVMDGRYGIWSCGAMRPNLTTAQVREIMAAPPSGDWRMHGGALELVAALCVNVPGFPIARVRKQDGLVASLIFSNPVREHPSRGVTIPAGVARRLTDRLAASIGRDRQSRVRELVARVHEGEG